MHTYINFLFFYFLFFSLFRLAFSSVICCMLIFPLGAACSCRDSLGNLLTIFNICKYFLWIFFSWLISLFPATPLSGCLYLSRSLPKNFLAFVCVCVQVSTLQGARPVWSSGSDCLVIKRFSVIECGDQRFIKTKQFWKSKLFADLYRLWLWCGLKKSIIFGHFGYFNYQFSLI